MSDVYCQSCNEPWEAWGIVFDEDLPFEPLATVSTEEWKITWGGDQDAAAVGELIVHRCPCCKSNKEYADVAQTI